MSSIIKVNTFQDANGNALFSSDGSGNVTLSSGDFKSTPAFKARLSANQSIPNATLTKINLNAKDIDTDNAFDISNYKFTVPSGKGGVYLIGYCLATDAVIDDTERLFARIYLNGAGQLYTIANDWSPSGSNDMFVNYSVIMDLSVGDYLELYMYHNEGGAINCNPSYTRLWGYRLIGA